MDQHCYCGSALILFGSTGNVILPSVFLLCLYLRSVPRADDSLLAVNETDGLVVVKIKFYCFYVPAIFCSERRELQIIFFYIGRFRRFSSKVWEPMLLLGYVICGNEGESFYLPRHIVEIKRKVHIQLFHCRCQLSTESAPMQNSIRCKILVVH